jgi:hypothetical protein
MPSSSLPTPQSYEQILSDMLSSYASSIGIDDFNVGGVALSLFEVVALATARTSGDIFQVLTANSVMRATGYALQQIAIENGVTPLPAQVANGYVNVTDTSFTKISSVIYAGANPPNVGSTTIYVADGSTFPLTGSVYLGRGTPDIEGPLPYSSVTQTGSYWTMILTSPTTKYHNVGETIVLSQGGLRTIPLNAIVISPGIGSTANLQYQTTSVATILDGETIVQNVPIAALAPGASNNVPSNSINSFAAPPFSGATVINPLPLTSGSDGDTDDTLRARIQLALASTGLGTVTAIQNAVIGATAPDQNDVIQSASVLTSTNGSATVYIDDGTGYEATFAGVGIETIITGAIGGEQFFQLATGGTQAPVCKAFLESTQVAPFDLIGSDTLAITVGETTYQHVFQNSDFLSPGGATAFEVTASVNADTTLGFEAVTSGGGTLVIFRAKAEAPDSVQTALPTTSGRNASVLLGLPSSQEQTLRLYKNNIPLSKDGNIAEVFTQSQALWSSSISNGDTLILSVDGTASITYTILNSDFIATGLYTSVSSTNSLASWAQVFNNKLTGVTAAVLGNQITLSSNLGVSNRAQVVIDPSSTLVTKAMFSSTLGLTSQGRASDFTLDRNTAQFELVTPLVAGDDLDAGSDQTQATVQSSSISATSITFPGEAHVWFLIDEPGQIILTGVQPGTFLTVSKPSTNVVRYTSSVSGAFSNVLPGDYVIVWSPQLASANQLEGRVYATSSTTLDILVTPAEYSAATPVSSVSFSAGFVVLRSTLAPQKFEIAAGTLTLNQIVLALQAQTNSMTFNVYQEEFLQAFTTTLATYGSLLVVTADINGQLMDWPIGTYSTSQTSLIASYDSQETEADMPLFIHTTVADGTAANPIDSYITSLVSSTSLAGRDPNELLSFLNPYGTIPDAQPYGEWVQESAISGTTIDITEDPDLRRLRGQTDGNTRGDRFYVASPLDFGYADTAVVVLDENPVSETFTIPFYRRAQTNTTDTSNPNNFNAYDLDSGANTLFSTYFPSFDFSNFKVLMQAKKVLQPETDPTNTAILYRSTDWGRSGEYITVGYVYPAAANANLSSTVTVTSQTNIGIVLDSGAAVPTAIDGTTQWNVTITTNTPSAGIDQVTYTWNGTGTNPGLSLTPGDYVNITSQTQFSPANTGVFSLSTQGGYGPSPTSFTVQRPTGVAVVESNKATMASGAITFYGPATSTANEIITYVNANLSQYISAALANWLYANDGSGVIALSTYEDSGFSFQSVQLEDGINWIASSNVSGSPQFSLKEPLVLPTDTGYAFNNAEIIVLSPTTMDQVRRLISILAVTGFTVYGSTVLSDRGNKLNLSTDTLGSGGAIQIIGGSANQYGVPVLFSATRLDNTYMQVVASNVASAPMASDQWFSLQAAQAQAKDTLFGNNTSVTIVGNTPTTGEAQITLSGRTSTQRYFGKPRNNIRSEGDTFRIEKQGSLACLSWNPNSGSDPMFEASVSFNDTGGGTLSVALVAGTDDSLYTILSGTANFSELSIGDLLIVTGLSNAANNGTFLVSGIALDGTSVQVLNPDAMAESSDNYVAAVTFTATTGVSEGDTMILSAPFNVLNQGQFRIIREYNNSVWFSNPDVVQEEVLLAYNAVGLGFDTTTTFNVTTTNNMLTLTYGGTGTVPTLGNAQMGDILTLTAPFTGGNVGSFMVITSSTSSNSLTAIDPAVGAQSGVTGVTSSELQVHRPQMQFYEYEATVPGDDFVITGSTLMTINQGSYGILQVIDQNNAIVTGTLTNVTNVSLNGAVGSVYVQEGVPYTGYKHVYLVAPQPGSTTNNYITFDTNAQYEKVNQAAAVEMTSLNKMNYNTTLETGLDSYYYNTGLIREANRIIYGDPRDPITYPGVGAAGADIFVREPLVLRVQVSIDVRLNTGVPFTLVSTQVRSTVSGLINSNPVGQSIAISDIITQVQAIPGVISVAISSPLYNVSNDLITVVPSQKTIIIDPSVDISVNQIGSS